MTSKISLTTGYGQLLRMEHLQLAWEKVRSKGTAGGVDEVTVKMFEKHLPKGLLDLQAELEARCYVPDPYLTVFIPKNKEEQRQLGLLTVRDKVVQQAVLLVIAPVLDQLFLDCSYGYRPNKGPTKAVRRVWHMIHSEQNRWFVKLDFDNFFDNIPHDLLLKKLEVWVQDGDLLNLIQLSLKMGSVEKNLDWTDRKKGVPQGALLSPILSNLYLHDMDEYIVRERIGYVRYADDFVLLTKSEGAARDAHTKVESYIRKRLQLPLNEGAVVAPLSKGLEFLGLQFFQSNYGLSKEKIQKLKAKLSASIDLKSGELPAKYGQTLEGIKNYYGRLVKEDHLMVLDAYIKRRLEAEIKQHKSKFRTQKSIRLALATLQFFTSVFETAKKEIIKELSGSKRKLPANRKVLNSQSYKTISRKKAEYEKLQSAAIELSINQPGVLIGISRKRITVKKKGKNILRVPTANVKYISVFSGGILLSSDLIHYCTRHDIPIDIFKSNGELSARLYDPVSPNETLWQAQLQALRDKRGVTLAKTWVSNKINNQLKLLKYFLKSRKTKPYAKEMEEKIKNMKAIKSSMPLMAIDKLKDLRQSLFGKEGGSGALYWGGVKLLLEDNKEGKVKFESRKRKGATDLVNVLLNYGYGILYSRVWDALLRAQLSPYISYLHTMRKGKPTLSFDLIEEFRQSVVDRTVIAMLNRGVILKLKNGQLQEASRKLLVNKILERLNSFENFRGQRLRLSEIIRLQARALAQYIETPNYVYKPYALKW